MFSFPSNLMKKPQTLSAHRLILSIKSSRFKSVFEQFDATTPLNTIQLPIEIRVEDIPFTIFSIFIQFLYTDNALLVHKQLQDHADSLLGQYKALARVSSLYAVSPLFLYTDNALLVHKQLQDHADSLLGQYKALARVSSLYAVSPLCQRDLPPISLRAQDDILCPILNSAVGKRLGAKVIREILCQRTCAPVVHAVRNQLEHVVVDLLRSVESCNMPMDEELPLVAALSADNEKIIRLLLVEYDATMLLFSDRTPHLLLACYK
ncbi:hypothetical protein ABG067_006890 [Albugo candida]